MPFYCYNKNDYCYHSENCEGCNAFVFGKGGKEVPSRADRIRAMSDVELARFLADKLATESCNRLNAERYNPTATEIESIRHTWYCAWKQWLKQPAEGDVNNA